MPKKSRVLVLTVAPFLILFLTGCPTDSEKFAKNCDFRKTVEKKVATAGEKLEVTLSIKNRSSYDVEYYELDKEVNQKDFLVVGGNFHIGRNLGKWKTHTIVFHIIPLRSGKLNIGPSKIFRVKLEKEEKAFRLPKNVGFSNSIPLEVKPLKLEIQPYLKKATVRLGETLELFAVIWNHGQTTIRGVNVTFEKDIPELRPEFSREFIEIPPGGHKKARFRFRAVKAGKITPGRAVAFFGRREIEGERFSSTRIFGISKKSLAQIQIDEVSLPGMEHPLRCYTKEISGYFDFIILKILGIALSLLLIIILFSKAIYSRFMEYFHGRVLLSFAMVGVLEIILIFLGYGISWCLHSTPPSLWEIAMIITCSCGLSLFFGVFTLKKPLLGSIFSGLALSTASYLIYVGFFACALNGFMDFPVREAALLGLLSGIALNAVFLKKEIKRR